MMFLTINKSRDKQQNNLLRWNEMVEKMLFDACQMSQSVHVCVGFGVWHGEKASVRVTERDRKLERGGVCVWQKATERGGLCVFSKVQEKKEKKWKKQTSEHFQDFSGVTFFLSSVCRSSWEEADDEDESPAHIFCLALSALLSRYKLWPGAHPGLPTKVLAHRWEIKDLRRTMVSLI